MLKPPYCFLIFLILLSGCETASLITDQERTDYKAHLEREKTEYYFDHISRISKVGYAILEKLPPQDRKKEVARLPFVLLESKHQFSHFKTEDIQTKAIYIIDVVPNWIGSATHVQRGDRLVAINDKPVTTLQELNKLQPFLLQAKGVTATFKRGFQTWTESVPVVKLDYDVPFVIDPEETSENAYFHFKGYVAITTVMLRFLENDDELAFVLAHEMAHALKGHLGQQWVNQSISNYAAQFAASLAEQYVSGAGGSTRALTSAFVRAPFSKHLEREADEAAVKYMIHAGYNPNGAVSFMSRMMGRHPQDNSYLSTHPPSEERLSNVRNLINSYGQHAK